MKSSWLTGKGFAQLMALKYSQFDFGDRNSLQHLHLRQMVNLDHFPTILSSSARLVSGIAQALLKSLFSFFFFFNYSLL